jgi:hypothetical protein
MLVTLLEFSQLLVISVALNNSLRLQISSRIIVILIIFYFDIIHKKVIWICLQFSEEMTFISYSFTRLGMLWVYCGAYITTIGPTPTHKYILFLSPDAVFVQHGFYD